MVKMVSGLVIQPLQSILWLNDRGHNLVRVCLATAWGHPRLGEAYRDDGFWVQRVTTKPLAKVSRVVSGIGDLELVLDSPVAEPEADLGSTAPWIARNHDFGIVDRNEHNRIVECR